jgi:hypothetical protein
MSTQPATAGPLPPDKNMGNSLIAFMWALNGISALILALRLFAVYKVLNRVRAADYLMVASYVRLDRYAPKYSSLGQNS